MKNVIVVFAQNPIDIDAREEFLGLCEACELEIVRMFFQNVKEISHRTYIGSGKAAEIKEYMNENEVDGVLFANNLSAVQLKNLEEIFDCPIMDYSDVILEIFERRAASPLSRLQVECARLKRVLPRLIGANQSLSRQGGGGLNKGSGEKKLELDRRRIKSRISEIERELKSIKKQRDTQRQKRLRSNLPIVSLIGYTNAGKSTLMNALLKHINANEDKQVLQQDMLFATLDTSLRQIQLKGGLSFLLSDTVGFISNLPHELVDAFHSTLEEVTYADLLLEVVDISDEQANKQMAVTKETLNTIKAGHLPILRVYNQCDKTDIQYPKAEGDEVYISAIEEDSIMFLLNEIQKHLFPSRMQINISLPYHEGSLLSYIHEHASIQKEEYLDESIELRIEIDEMYIKPLKEYIKIENEN
ncbi:MAG: GTPase HflX [Longicatena sp.]|nr:GTPase HflX [Longicatena sp.]